MDTKQKPNKNSTLPRFFIYAAIISASAAFAYEAIAAPGLNISPPGFLLSAALFFTIICALAALFNNLWQSAAAVSLISYILSIISYNKYIYRDEPLYFSDLALSGRMRGFFGGDMIVFTIPMALTFIAYIIICVLLYIFYNMYLNKKTRVITLLLSVICFITLNFITTHTTASGYFLDFIKTRPAIFPRNTTPADNPRPQTRTTPAADTEPPHIIIILSESFWDPYSMPNLPLSADPIPFFRELSQNTVSGNMISSTFGGGTDLVEFALLTGISREFISPSPYTSLRHPVMSLASIFREKGYITSAVHTYQKDFYNRDRAYPHLGFDTYTAQEDMDDFFYNGPYIDDTVLMRHIIKDYEKAAALGKRAFIFGISMQNHQPYLGKYPNSPVTPTDPDMPADLRNSVSSFLRGLNDADNRLRELVQYFNAVDEPVVILYFGDHQPTIGPQFELYRYTGNMVSPEDRTLPELHSILKTPFLIWSNYKNEPEHIENIDAAFLGNLLLNYIGAEKPYFYHYIDDLYNNARFISRMDLFYIDGDDNLREADDMDEKLTAMLEEYAALVSGIMSGS